MQLSLLLELRAWRAQGSELAVATAKSALTLAQRLDLQERSNQAAVLAA